MDFFSNAAFALSVAVVVLGVVLALTNMKISRLEEPLVGERGLKGDKGDKGEVGDNFELETVNVKIVNDMLIKDERFKIPKRATDGSAAIDLQACIDEPILIKAGESVLVGTGVAIHVENKDFAGIILPRSGLGSRDGIVLGNLVGLIDSDYQGELMVSVWNRSWEDYTLEPATKFAQYMVIPVMTPRLRVVSEFESETVRGSGGFGSTGQ